MSYTKITAHIVDQTLQLANLPLLASGGIEEIQIDCDFCPLWNGYGKTAVFYRKGGPVYHLALIDNSVVVPWEVLTEPGVVFFGLMGVATNTRTTEVVQIRIDQGAITTSASEPAEPTPDLYGQLLAALAINQARIDQLVSMRSGAGATVSPLQDEYISGEIRTNGASAYVSATISGMSLLGGGYHFTDYCIKPELAPLGPVMVQSSNPDINVTIEQASQENGGWARLLIENVGNAMLTTDMVTYLEAYYPLASVSIAELGDIRRGYDGQEYATAGDAVRDQISALIGYPGAVPTPNSPEIAELLAAYNTVARALDSHEADTSNPHRVTAAQVGARPNTWMPSASDVGAIPSDLIYLTNRSVLEWATSLNCTAWAAADPSTMDMPPNANISNHAIVTANVGVANGWIELRVNYVLTGCVAVRIYNYSWGEWEWENPPMALGAEYRTTERYNGSPVYTKLVDFGELPNTSTKSINCGVHASNMLSMTLRAVSSEGLEMMNEIGGHAYAGTLFMWEGSICIRTQNDQSRFHGYITTKYIK